ncbi:MAG: hypothetical protein AAGF51_14615 [Pseudomonadota bacterium]
MGWRPAEVRACSWADFLAAWEGFCASKGVKRGLDDQEIDGALALMDKHGWT